MSAKRVKVKLDDETQRILDWLCEKLNMTPEQVLDEAVGEYLKERGGTQAKEDKHVKVEFEIAKFAVDFLEDYLKFLGSSWTVADVARDAFFEEICGIRDKLADMWHQQDRDFFKKYPHIAMLDNREQQKWIVEQERRSDC